MANVFRGIPLIFTSTALTTVYTANATCRALVQNCQLTNAAGNHDISGYIYDSAKATTYLVGVTTIGANETLPLNIGAFVIEENCSLLIQVNNTTVSGHLAIMEINRSAVSK